MVHIGDQDCLKVEKQRKSPQLFHVSKGLTFNCFSAQHKFRSAFLTLSLPRLTMPRKQDPYPELQAVLKLTGTTAASLPAALRKKVFKTKLVDVYRAAIAVDSSAKNREDGGKVVSFIDSLLNHPSIKSESARAAARSVVWSLMEAIHPQLELTPPDRQLRNMLEDAALFIGGLSELGATDEQMRKHLANASATSSKSVVELYVGVCAKYLPSAFLTVRALEVLYELHKQPKISTLLSKSIAALIPKQYKCDLVKVLVSKRRDFVLQAMQFAQSVLNAQKSVDKASRGLTVEFVAGNTRVKRTPVFFSVSSDYMNLIFNPENACSVLSIKQSEVMRDFVAESTQSSRHHVVFAADTPTLLEIVDAPPSQKSVDVIIEFNPNDSAVCDRASTFGHLAKTTLEASSDDSTSDPEHSDSSCTAASVPKSTNKSGNKRHYYTPPHQIAAQHESPEIKLALRAIDSQSDEDSEDSNEVDDSVKSAPASSEAKREREMQVDVCGPVGVPRSGSKSASVHNQLSTDPVQDFHLQVRDLSDSDSHSDGDSGIDSDSNSDSDFVPEHSRVLNDAKLRTSSRQQAKTNTARRTRGRNKQTVATTQTRTENVVPVPNSEQAHSLQQAYSNTPIVDDDILAR